MLYPWKAQGPRTSKLIFPIVKYTNTNLQIYNKYTNTPYDKVPEIPNICYIFEQLVVQGCQKWYSPECYEIRSKIQSDPRSKSRLVDFRLLYCPPVPSLLNQNSSSWVLCVYWTYFGLWFVKWNTKALTHVQVK